MNVTVNLDKTGRVVLPKALRDELHLLPGDSLDLTVEGEQVTLRPKRTAAPLQKERGIWVFRIGEPLTVEDARAALRQLRELRWRRQAGDDR